MSHVAPANGSRPAVTNGASLHDGDLPTSTLAAQLVDNLTRATQQSRHQDREDFEQLLRIFETDSQNERLVDEPDSSDESIKLIDVVVKAGLDVLARDNPFEDRRVIIRQALRSLAVIEATLRRSPALLFMPQTQDEPTTRFHSPLYAWLMPKLWTSLVLEADEEFHSAVSQCLASIIASGKKMRSKAPRSQPLKRYVQGCIRGMSLNNIVLLV